MYEGQNEIRWSGMKMDYGSCEEFDRAEESRKAVESHRARGLETTFGF